MRILLVGGSSALALVLKPVLAALGDVVTAGRRGCDMEIDLSWPAERIRLPTRIDVVVNAAAHFGGGEFESILEAENVNALGGLKLCHAALKGGAKHIVVISSINACLEHASSYYGIYSLSKRHADELTQLYCAKVDLPCTVLRPSQLYGDPDVFRRHQPFLYNGVDKALGNENIVIYGSRNALRNYLHADDLCRIIAAVVQGRVEGSYPCTNRKDVGLADLADTIIRATRSASKVVFDTAMKDLADNVFPYDDTLYRKIEVSPEIDLEVGIRKLVASRLPKA